MELTKGDKARFSPQGHGGKLTGYLKSMFLKEAVRLTGGERTARQEGKFRPSVGAI